MPNHPIESLICPINWPIDPNNSLKYLLNMPTQTRNSTLHPLNRPSDTNNNLKYILNGYTYPS
jgi:hypothetical protein